MKRLILITLALLCLAGIAAASQSLVNSSNAPVQDFAPDGTLSAAVTGNVSTTTDLSNNIKYGIYCGSASKMRLMPTSAKGTYPQHSIPASTWIVRTRNPATPFLNISGACELQRQ